MTRTAKSKLQPIASIEPERADATPLAGPTHEEVAIRAYRIYLERGDADGSPLEDWLQAENELALCQ